MGEYHWLLNATRARTVDKNETGASTPVTEQSSLDLVMSDGLVDEGIALEEDHG